MDQKDWITKSPQEVREALATPSRIEMGRNAAIAATIFAETLSTFPNSFSDEERAVRMWENVACFASGLRHRGSALDFSVEADRLAELWGVTRVREGG